MVTIQLKSSAEYACGVTRAPTGKHTFNKNRTTKIRVFTYIIVSDNSVRAGLKTRPIMGAEWLHKMVIHNVYGQNLYGSQK
ncbi:MAG: hypothetical protein RL497_1369 [Pseudomonadota bacterium]|jgi:hypothetical protein